MFVDALKKIQKSAYVSMNSLSQPARTSKFERQKRQFIVTAYFDYRRQVPTRKDFLKKVGLCIVMDQELICEIIHSSSF